MSRTTPLRALALGALGALALAAPALASTTVGQTFGPPSTYTFGCGGGYSWADQAYTVPAPGGTITSFSFQSVAANAGEQLDFFALRPEGNSYYKVLGHSGLETLAGTGGVETFTLSTPIPVGAGDIIGQYHPGLLDNCGKYGGGPLLSRLGNPSDGSTAFFNSFPGEDINLSANVEPPTPVTGDGTTNPTSGPANTFHISTTDGSLTYSGSNGTFNGAIQCVDVVGNTATLVALDSSTGLMDRTRVQDNGSSGDKLINMLYDPAKLNAGLVSRLSDCWASQPAALNDAALSAAPALPGGDTIQIGSGTV